jgi:hypothetical protein
MLWYGFLLMLFMSQNAADEDQVLPAADLTLRVPKTWEPMADPDSTLLVYGERFGQEGMRRESLRITVMPAPSWTPNLDQTFDRIEGFLKVVAKGEFSAAGHRILWQEYRVDRPMQNPPAIVDYRLIHSGREYHFRFTADNRRIASLRATFDGILKSIGPPESQDLRSPSQKRGTRLAWCAGVAFVLGGLMAWAIVVLLRSANSGKGRLFLWLTLPLFTAFVVFVGAWVFFLVGEKDTQPGMVAGFLFFAFPAVVLSGLHLFRTQTLNLLVRIPSLSSAQFVSLLRDLGMKCSASFSLLAVVLLAGVQPEATGLAATMILFFGSIITGLIGSYLLGRRLKHLAASKK